MYDLALAAADRGRPTTARALPEEGRVVAGERGLRDLAGEGEHREAAILQFCGLLAAELDGVRGLERLAPAEVAGLALAVHRGDDGGDAREGLEKRHEQQDLAERARRDEAVV